MDILDIIREKIELLPDNLKLNIDTVVTHLKVAEEHYHRGKESEDEQFFTDVIYRCNHAFEGILREAFSVIANKDPSSKTVYEIEQFFAENNLLRPRVLELFTKYRQDWRNPSTHDHKLFFSEGEALLALLNVQAFVAVILDQIIEKIGYTLGYREESIPSLAKTDVPLLDRVVHLLQEFSTNDELWKDLISDRDVPPQRFFPQILGMLEGFLASQAPDLEVELEPEIARRIRPDIIISDSKEKIIIEIKVGKPSTSKFHGITQLSYMLAASGVKEGVLFLMPRQPTPLKKEEEEIGPLKVVILSPLHT